MAGVDISALPVLEDHGAVYRDGGVVGDPIDIFTDNGVNWARLRLFVDPRNDDDDFVVNDIPYTISLAQRAKAAGAKLLLDFHYSDTWADPGKQYKPADWENLSFAQLEQQVYDYTRASIEAFDQAGVRPEMVQIGNEISNGMLWDDGYPWSGGSHNDGFDRLANLLKAGIEGAKAGVSPGDEPLIMIHHDKGAEWGTTRYYFDKLRDRDLEFDVIGYSYYPKFHYDNGDGDMDAVAANLTNTANRYGKPVVVVETGFASRGAFFEPDYEFDVSPNGQREFLESLVEAVEDVPDELGWGVFWWYPEARPAQDVFVWEGGRYGLFDQNGNALPALDVFNNLNLPGDYNGDGMVNAEDLETWSNTYGTTGTPLPADGNQNGIVDGADFLVWQRSVGSLPPSLSIPEPAAFVLVWSCFAIGLQLRIRRNGEPVR